nr:hypothetical protein [Tanacetum cinerariifolium]
MPLNLAERPGAGDIADADLFDQKHRKPKLMSRNFLQHLNPKSSRGGMERLSSGLKGWGEHVSGWERLAGKHVAQLQWFESGDGGKGFGTLGWKRFFKEHNTIMSNNGGTQFNGNPRRKVTEVPQPSDPIEHVVDEAVYKELDDRLVRVATTVSSLEAEQDNGNTLQSDEDSLKLNELMELRTNLQSRVLDLEKIKTTQALKIDSLKRMVKKLEKKQRSRTHKLKRLYKVGLSARVESSDDNEDLGEDASKQERKIHDIDVDEDITLVNDQDDEQMFDVNDL